MGSRKFDGSQEWYLGLDVGTNSVGWAATDTEYNVLKFNGNSTWGIYLFDEAKNAADRRLNRTARRRLQRKKQRIGLLQDFFAEAISKVDDKFYIRLKESQLWSEDRTTGIDHQLFVGGELNDKVYNETYPTIHHLICELMDNDEDHDPRLVYMACSYILSHRGHFLIEVDENNVDKVTDFRNIYDDFLSWFSTSEIDEPWICSADSFAQVMKKKQSIGYKEKSFYDLLFDGKKPTNEDGQISVKDILSFLSGRKTKIADLFLNEEYKSLEIASISITSVNLEDELDSLSAEIDDIEYDLLLKLKRIYDWSVLVDVLQGEKFISKAKVNVYEQHKKDVRFLKYIIKGYAPNKYNFVFRDVGKENNYASYSYNVKDFGKSKTLPSDFKMCNAEEFSKFVDTIVRPLEPEISEKEADQFTDMLERLTLRTFCPKQVTSDNRVIPYQLYYAELKTILENSSRYLPFMNDQDEYGTTAAKILSIMKFRIPYYVGPLTSSKNSSYAWMVRKNEGKITPWNFEEMIDKDRSEENFIRRMTCKCSYLAGADVLPHNSLLYAKYMVLNEINNIRVNENKISPEAKQGIYENLFMKKRRVSVKNIQDYLISNGYMKAEDEIKGLDISIKSELKAYHDFKPYITSGILNERQVEDIINRITLTTDHSRLKVWLISEYQLPEEDAKKISKLKYKDFGRLSKELLTEVYDVDSATGELRREENIIGMLWSTNENLMNLRSKQYGYFEHIEQFNRDYYSNNPMSIDSRLADMYISNAVKRPILRTLEITKELSKIFNRQPKKIFIEMARGAKEEQKKKRTKSRKDQIKELYANLDQQEVAKLLSEIEDKTDDQMRSEKLFLYFSQLGKCMYSGEPINISEIGNNKLYDVDHIWPQSKIKDDSLDNKVLVLSKYNGEKGDKYPIAEQWRSARFSMWKLLCDKKLISDKKFDRLKRSTTFTDEELAAFIDRQLVETRQSTKAIATLLGETMPESDIVYVKADLVSSFRQEYKDDYFTLKCREVNDFHHAKDAYLNIVMGNIYDVKFTRNPINFIKTRAQYTLNLNKILSFDVERNGVVAWKTDNDSWFDKVISTIQKNNIRFVRYSYCQKGALFDIKPMRKGLGQVPRKKEMDKIERYGGYNKQTVTGFYLISYEDKKSRETTLIAVPLLKASGINNLRGIKEFCIAEGYKNPEVLLNGRMIKTNSLWEIDGYRVHLSCKSADYVWFKGAQQLVLSSAQEIYIKKIYKYCERANGSKELPAITSFDQISAEDNIDLYEMILNKIKKTKYNTLMHKACVSLENGRNIFIKLSVENQTKVLTSIVKLFSCNDSNGKDLTLIGGVKSAGIQLMPMKFNNKKFTDIRIIDQSATGLFEKKSPNLLTL
jgi:CRISPR-associated endonuclease Csn1